MLAPTPVAHPVGPSPAATPAPPAAGTGVGVSPKGQLSKVPAWIMVEPWTSLLCGNIDEGEPEDSTTASAQRWGELLEVSTSQP